MYESLASVPERGPEFAATIRQLLLDESSWAAWKQVCLAGFVGRERSQRGWRSASWHASVASQALTPFRHAASGKLSQGSV